MIRTQDWYSWKMPNIFSCSTFVLSRSGAVRSGQGEVEPVVVGFDAEPVDEAR